MTEWTPDQQADADASCATMTAIRKGLRAASAGDAVASPHDVEAVRGLALAVAGARRFVGQATRSWGVAPDFIADQDAAAEGVEVRLNIWLLTKNPKRRDLQPAFKAWVALHEAAIAIADGVTAPRPVGEGGGDGGGK